MKLSKDELMIIGIDIEEKLGLLEPALQDYIVNGPFQAWRSIKATDLRAAIERRRGLLTRIYDERRGKTAKEDEFEADAEPPYAVGDKVFVGHDTWGFWADIIESGNNDVANDVRWWIVRDFKNSLTNHTVKDENIWPSREAWEADKAKDVNTFETVAYTVEGAVDLIRDFVQYAGVDDDCGGSDEGILKNIRRFLELREKAESNKSEEARDE